MRKYRSIRFVEDFFSQPHVLLLVALILFQTSALALDGNLDPSFGSMGRLTFPLPGGSGDYVVASAELPDGRIVIAGVCGENACIARLRSNGTFDPTFGPQGFGYVAFDEIAGVPVTSAAPADMAVLPDGRMALLASPSGDSRNLEIFLIRADGTALDTSNGGSGFAAFLFGSLQPYSCPCRIVAQPDGKLLATADVSDDPFGIVIAVGRTLENISGYDPSFGNQGVSVVAFNIGGPGVTDYDFAAAIAVQTDGKIVIGANGHLSNNAYGIELARLTANGARDPTFGPNGDGRFTLTDPSHSLFINNIASDPRQRLVFVGSKQHDLSPSGTDSDALVGRLTSGGLLDTSFVGTGISVFDPLGTSGPRQSAQSVAVTADSIFVASSAPRSQENSSNYFAVTRLKLDGSLNPTFGGGTLFYSYSSDSISDDPTNLLLTHQGIIVSGNARNANDQVVGVARLVYDGIFANTFE